MPAQSRGQVFVPSRGVRSDFQGVLGILRGLFVIADDEVLAGEITHSNVVAGIGADIFLVAINGFFNIADAEVVIERGDIESFADGLAIGSFVGLLDFLGGLGQLAKVVIADGEAGASQGKTGIEIDRFFVERDGLEVAFFAVGAAGFGISLQGRRGGVVARSRGTSNLRSDSSLSPSFLRRRAAATPRW